MEPSDGVRSMLRLTKVDITARVHWKGCRRDSCGVSKAWGAGEMNLLAITGGGGGPQHQWSSTSGMMAFAPKLLSEKRYVRAPADCNAAIILNQGNAAYYRMRRNPRNVLADPDGARWRI